jgi:5-methylcytosine-specific restriction enzyme A
MPYAAPHACTGRSPGCLRSAPHGERWCAPCKAERQRADTARRGDARTERGYDWRWRRYREAYLRRHPLCAECLRQGRTTAARVVDHIRPHKGDQRLFWDPANHQSLCDYTSPWNCHGRKTALEDGGFGRPARSTK